MAEQNIVLVAVNNRPPDSVHHYVMKAQNVNSSSEKRVK